MPSMRLKDLFKAKKTTPFGGVIGPGAALLMVIGAVGAATLVTRRESPARPAGQEARARQVPAPRATATDAVQSPVAARSQEPAKATAPKTVSAGAPRAARTAKIAEQPSPIVTLTGCLEQRDETFRLKDTAGTDAPKSRTWKTAFLKKGPAPIEVVDRANRLKLEDHVGQRVNVTGTLVDREMQVRSLQRVAESCKNSQA